VEFSQGISP